jgi:hypothetical protein
MHFFQRWSSLLPFQVVVGIFLCKIGASFDENFYPPRQILSLGHRKKSLGARSGEYGGWWINSNFVRAFWLLRLPRCEEGNKIFFFFKCGLFVSILLSTCQVTMRNKPPLLIYLFQDSRWAKFHNYPKKQSPSSFEQFHPSQSTVLIPVSFPEYSDESKFSYESSEKIRPFRLNRSKKPWKCSIRIRFWSTEQQVSKLGTQRADSFHMLHSVYDKHVLLLCPKLLLSL